MPRLNMAIFRGVQLYKEKLFYFNLTYLKFIHIDMAEILLMLKSV
jgi:hypothetical protein